MATTHGLDDSLEYRIAKSGLIQISRGGQLVVTVAGPRADESAVLRMHAGNGEHVEMDRRAEAAFDAGLAELGSPVGTSVGDTLSAYFRWANVRMAAHHHGPDDVASGQSIPRWSWDKPVTGGAIREK